jgi:proton-translocating NADH-quinone oxidoreductase chain M
MIEPALLNLVIWLPLLGALGLLLFADERGGNAARWWAAVISAVTLLLSGYLYFRFDMAAEGFQFISQVDWLRTTGFNFGSTYHVGVDGVSMPLVLLNALLGFLAVLISWHSVTRRTRLFYALLLVLQTAVAGVFASLDFFLFFLFWELELAPMFLLIGIFGGLRREYAAFKFILYTLFGSAFMLVGILALYFGPGEQTFNMLILAEKARGFELGFQLLIFVLLAIGFAIKIPIVPFHTWLPDAHTEAPTAGSVLLAGVLLKMGAYGLLRLCVNFLPDAAAQLALLIGILAVINVLYGAYLAMAQVIPTSKQQDLKKLIANSSISSMGFVLLGIAALNQLGLQGAVLQMFTHGLYSGLLFMMVGLVYDRTHTRDIPRMGGLLAQIPFIGTGFIIAGLAALGLPGMATFISEFTVFLGGYSSAAHPALPVLTILCVIGIVLTAAYVLWTVMRVFHGPLAAEWAAHPLPDAAPIERFAVVALIAVTLLVGIYPGILAPMVAHGIEPIAALFQG